MPQLGQINCRRCWKPLTHCACDMATLLTHDEAALQRLEALNVRAADGAYPVDLDQYNVEQQRWAFLVWLDDHGKLAHG